MLFICHFDSKVLHYNACFLRLPWNFITCFNIPANSKTAFHLTRKTSIASIAKVAVNGKHVAGWRYWYCNVNKRCRVCRRCCRRGDLNGKHPKWEFKSTLFARICQIYAITFHHVGTLANIVENMCTRKKLIYGMSITLKNILEGEGMGTRGGRVNIMCNFDDV